MSTVWTFGPAGSYTATWDGSSILTVTQTTGSQFVASFAAQSLAAAIASPEYQAILSPAPNAVTGLQLAAATGASGFALINGTPAILSWTAPNDGALHMAFITATHKVTVNETGGQLATNWTVPDGSGFASNFLPAAQVAGTYTPSQILVVKAGSTVSLVQNTALTAGAATTWAQIWAA